MTTKEARQFLVKLAKSKKYKVTPGTTTFNFYKLLDKTFEYLTGIKPKSLGSTLCESKVINFFFEGTYMADVCRCKLKNDFGINTAMELKKMTFDEILKEIETL